MGDEHLDGQNGYEGSEAAKFAGSRGAYRE